MTPLLYTLLSIPSPGAILVAATLMNSGDTTTMPGELTRVLLIEDSPGYTYIIKDMLLRQIVGRFALESASDLATGLSLLRQRRIDVVLLDLGLADSVGYETFARVRAESPHIPIIILTAVDDEDLAVRAMRHGAQDYLVKEQVDKNLIHRAIRYAIERAKVEQSLRHLSGRLLKLQDEERRRIARELHDVTAQKMAAVSMNLGLLQGTLKVDDEKGRHIVKDCLAATEDCSNELRTLSYLLHTPLLEELGLAGAVRDYADGFSRRSGIRVDLEISDLGDLTREMEGTLFRVLQEALNNIHRHSGSATASIRLYRDVDGVTLEVQDAGKGMPQMRGGESELSAYGLGVGILGRRERLRQLGGRLDIQSGPKGTLVKGSMPVRASET